MLRVALIILIVAIVFLTFNLLSVRQLLRIHPRRKRPILAIAIGCNLMWLFLPIVNARSDFSRFIRATLGPPWFAWTVFTILYSFVIAAALFVWLLFARRRPFAEFARVPSRAFILLCALGGLAGMVEALVPLRVERVPVAIASLPPQLDGFRIALLGDLHVGLYTRPSRLTKIFATTESLNPDAVVIAGDLVDDDPYFAPKLLAGTRALSPSRPLVAVLGNHEMYGDPLGVIAALRGSRIRLLVNEGTDVRGIWLAGISDYAGSGNLAPNFDAALAHRPTNAFPIVIAHQPKAFADARKRHLPLTLCAHTHGGQFGFRPLHWSLAGVFLPFHMGLYARGDSRLYVNTGTGYWLLPFRLGMTPEITLIELHRAPR